ncbi:MAG TPA: glycosyltransferase [Candidatus Limnocylindria bacterium]|nr:glycosyltransferase [Candidatus Limnocylindria bacterium]
MTEDALLCRKGAAWRGQILVLGSLCALALLLIYIVGSPRSWATHRLEVLLTLGGIAFWRWSWFVIQNVRAITYRYWAFPRIRREAELALAKFGPVPEVTVLGTTYHEKPWITLAVFGSVFRELSTIEGLVRPPKVIVVTGCDEDDQNIREIFAQCCMDLTPVNPAQWPPELVLARGDKGKRLALGTGMEEIARSGLRDDGVVIILDGDTMLQPGLVKKVLPVFRLTPTVSAITTNEDGVVKGPAWFAEWTSLRFGLRHRSMCSISLSGKLLCLTGRFSVFRASVVLDPSFRAQVEHDVIHHWLWGSFEMLSGDDKSTWFWLAKNGHRMLYVPDAMVTTFEVITGSSVHRAMANVRRWSGNSVRHGWRAIMLGPRKLNWFVWLCLVDQRLTMLTILFGPTVAIFSICTGRFEMAAAYLLWVISSRVAHAAISWRQGRRLSAYYVPLQIASDWITALTKLWVVFHPAKQNWLNRGARTLNTTRGSAFYKLRTGFAHYLYVFSCACVVVVVGLFVGFLPIFRDTRLFLRPKAEERSKNPAPSQSTTPALRQRIDGMLGQGELAGKAVSKDTISGQ